MNRLPILDEEGHVLLKEFVSSLEWLSREQQLIVLEMLERYLKEIELWNPRIGLIEASGHEVLYKHVFDCMAPGPVWNALLQPGQKALDVGTGAGLPGFLLSMLFPNVEWTLIDKQERRIAFLNNAKALCGSRNTRPQHTRLEELRPEFDIVTSRAFTPLDPESLSAYRNLIKPNGLIVLYKGRLDKIKEELSACKLEHLVSGSLDLAQLSSQSAHVVPVLVPRLSEERHLVIIRSQTSQ